MVDHCVAAFQNKQKDRLYQIYITDALKAIAENTANLAGGKSPQLRYIEVIDDMENTDKKPEKTAEEIIDNMKNKLANL